MSMSYQYEYECKVTDISLSMPYVKCPSPCCSSRGERAGGGSVEARVPLAVHREPAGRAATAPHAGDGPPEDEGEPGPDQGERAHPQEPRKESQHEPQEETRESLHSSSLVAIIDGSRE